MISPRDFDRTSALPTAVYGRTSGHSRTPSMTVLKSKSASPAYCHFYFPLHTTPLRLLISLMMY